jgi:hypothetical protein
MMRVASVFLCFVVGCAAQPARSIANTTGNALGERRCLSRHEGYSVKTLGSNGTPALDRSELQTIAEAKVAFPKADLRFAFSSNGCAFVLFDGKQFGENVGVLDPKDKRWGTGPPRAGLFYNKASGGVQAWAF